MNAPNRIGVFGGTFDPPHLAHRILAEEAQFQLGLDRVLWALTQAPPHKRDRSITSLEERLQMLQAAVAGNPVFEISRIDIDRPPPHYSVDSMHLLHMQFPESEFIYLMGGDSLRDLPTWHEPHKFIAACNAIGVMRRPGVSYDLSELELQLPGLRERVQFVDAPLLEISSTDIRQRIADGKPYRYYLPQPVYKIIHRQGLYAPAGESVSGAESS